MLTRRRQLLPTHLASAGTASLTARKEVIDKSVSPLRRLLIRANGATVVLRQINHAAIPQIEQADALCIAL